MPVPLGSITASNPGAKESLSYHVIPFEYVVFTCSKIFQIFIVLPSLFPSSHPQSSTLELRLESPIAAIVLATSPWDIKPCQSRAMLVVIMAT